MNRWYFVSAGTTVGVKLMQTRTAWLIIWGTLLLPGMLVPDLLQGQTQPVRASQEELAHSTRLRDQERELAAREERVLLREQQLAELEQSLEQELERLLELQREARETLDSLTAVKEQAFRDLIRVYSAMRPTRVAELLNQMSDRDALEILRGLKTDLVADIIPRLEQAKAVRLSRQLGLL